MTSVDMCDIRSVRASSSDVTTVVFRIVAVGLVRSRQSAGTRGIAGHGTRTALAALLSVRYYGAAT